MVLSSGSQIAHRSHLLLISDEDVLAGREFGLSLKEGLDEFSGLILRCIVDDDDMVIGVILHDDGFHVLEVPSLVSIVEGGNNNAKGKFRILIDIVFGLIIFPLFFTYC